MSKKTVIKLILGIIVTVVIIYYSVKTLGDFEIGDIFNRNIDWFLAALSTAIFIYANYVRGLCYTLGIDPEMDRMTAFRIVGIGHAANMVLPVHLGEGLRLVFFPSDYSIVRRTKLLIIPGFADFVAIIVISLLAVPFAGFTDPALLKALWILFLACIVAGVLCVAVVYFVPRFNKYAKEYMNAATAKMTFWVTISWVLMLVSIWLGLMAFGFNVWESVGMSLAVFATTNIINFIPASPGSIGLFEYATVLALGKLGVERSPALAAGILLHLIQYVALLPMAVVLTITAFHGKYREAIKAFLHKDRKEAVPESERPR